MGRLWLDSVQQEGFFFSIYTNRVTCNIPKKKIREESEEERRKVNEDVRRG